MARRNRYCKLTIVRHEGGVGSRKLRQVAAQCRESYEGLPALVQTDV